MSQLDCCPLRAKKDANPLETVKRIKTNKNEVWKHKEEGLLRKEKKYF